MKFSFVSLFPELLHSYFGASILSRAKEKSLISIDYINPRDFSIDKHKRVDDYMIGGGAGLLMMAQPLNDALVHVNFKNKTTHFIFLSPVGKKFKQNDAKRLAKKEHLCFVCGRYEGVDERVIEMWADEIFSIGDFILTGGEIASLCLADAISRNVNGVLGNIKSLDIESFENEILEAPSFTKPNIFQGLEVVSEFLKGNHANIRTLKKTMALCKTRYFRPDLYQKLMPKNKETHEK